ncbi:protein S100-P [Rhinophrynus dorsalis]
MSELETAVAMMIDVFDKYACVEGNKMTLTKGEMKSLLEKELPGILKNAKGKDPTEELMKDLDTNGDCEMDFNEFMVFVAALACLGHEKLEHVTHEKLAHVAHEKSKK